MQVCDEGQERTPGILAGVHALDGDGADRRVADQAPGSSKVGRFGSSSTNAMPIARDRDATTEAPDRDLGDAILSRSSCPVASRIVKLQAFGQRPYESAASPKGSPTLPENPGRASARSRFPSGSRTATRIVVSALPPRDDDPGKRDLDLRPLPEEPSQAPAPGLTVQRTPSPAEIVRLSTASQDQGSGRPCRPAGGGGHDGRFRGRRRAQAEVCAPAVAAAVAAANRIMPAAQARTRRFITPSSDVRSFWQGCVDCAQNASMRLIDATRLAAQLHPRVADVVVGAIVPLLTVIGGGDRAHGGPISRHRGSRLPGSPSIPWRPLSPRDDALRIAGDAGWPAIRHPGRRCRTPR